MEQGTDPADAKVQALARGWQDLLKQSTLGDVRAAPFGSKYDSRPIRGYVTKAIAAAKSSP
jgi:hypothetical protein